MFHRHLLKFVRLTLEERDCTGIWFPLVIRPSFTLGTGRRLCIKEDFDELFEV
jgi:carbamoylphosphate synthase large subunit